MADDGAQEGQRLGPPARLIRQEFGLDLVKSEPVGHGADAHARLWCCEASDGRLYAVKLSGAGSPAALALNAPGVPAPVPTADGRLWVSYSGARLSVVAWVSGKRPIWEGMTDADWESFGALLAQVHAAPPLEGLPVEEHTHDRVKAVALAVDERVKEPFDALTEALASAWSADRMARVLDRADQLGYLLRGRPQSNVVCHADPHLGNLLLGPDAQVWLIDWDDAILAPPERDLMFVLHDVLALGPARPSAFFAGYGQVELDADRLAYYRCVRALEDVADPAAQVLDPDRWTEQERVEALSIARGQLSPAGLVDLALA